MTIQRLLLAGALALLVPGSAGAATDSRIEGADPGPDTTVTDSSRASSTPAASADTVVAPQVTVVQREHRNLGQRVVRAAGNFGSDCWYVATSPTRLTLAGVAQLALVAGAEVAIYANDQAIMDAAQRNHDQPQLHAIHKFGDILEDAGFMPHTLEAEGGVWLIGAAFHSSTTQEICQELVEAHLIGGGIRNGLKILVGRAHPYEGRGSHVYEFGKGTSFPSGHTSIYFEAATVLAHHAHWWPATVALYGMAGAGAIQRVQARSHWPSDVFLPIVSGTLIGFTVVHRNQGRRAKEATWTPQIQASESGLRVGMGRRF